MSSSKQKVSIIFPTFNGSKYLKESLDSCLSQTYANIEVILVDDASTDTTPDILRQYTDERLIVLRHDKNKGLPGGLNTGFEHSTGDYLTWTSDDNRYALDAIATMVDYLEAHSDVDFVYAPYWTIDERGQKIELVSALPINKIMQEDPVGACFLYRRRVYEVIGNYDTNALLAEDYEYWLRVSQKFVMTPLDVPLYYYRLHPNSLTSQTGVIHKRLRLGARVKWKRFGLPWHRYWLEMARIDIDEAFACYRDGNYSNIPGLTLRGVARNPSWIFNRGVIAITLQALSRRKPLDNSQDRT
jgi:glycosyltransferase involved in cell wall biosynthesis